MPKKTFDKMTRTEKAVAIAKDVLKQLAAKKYRATPGVYKTVRSPTERLKRIMRNVIRNKGHFVP